MDLNYKNPNIKKCLAIYVECIEAYNEVSLEIDKLQCECKDRNLPESSNSRINILKRELVALSYDVASCEVRLELNNPKITNTQWN